ncbi:MAG: FAD-dependent monooxygenase [Rhodanobacter sp.]|nr:MAG: FAD-dependent monooxygenase [Rhodanobacter sp.]TAM10342.1 MAG: FAD-dependent monooxygenase [Rhodanobacter sp.]TAM34440.1 MAG: FAD-dependent monooxygenase [Rhodanobacter sp.]
MRQLPQITLIGGGLVGALLARRLAQRGFAVEVFEKRRDPRRAALAEGRSINLALAERGLQALRTTDLAETVLGRAVMMRGRMVHDGAQHCVLQRYGVDDGEVIWSASRNALNRLLLDAAEAVGVRLHFDAELVGADLERGRIRLADAHGTTREHDAGLLIGADGAGSALRAAMALHTPLGERVEPLGHGYKELEIPPIATWPRGAQPAAAHGNFALEPNALHIWPRGHYMCIALPNAEGSFTVTLFLPGKGAYPSFESLPDVAAARAFFAGEFPGLLPLIPDFDADWAGHPMGTLATLYLDRWHLDHRALLVGDAAHAIVPFHGQGMNCGFEDTVTLADLLAAEPHASAEVFVEFQRLRKPNTDAIAAMSLANYIEMRDAVADPHYLAKRTLEARLEPRIPRHFMAHYRMVAFTHLPYAYAQRRNDAQDVLIEQLLRDTPDPAAVDLDAACRLFQSQLEPLPELTHG